MRALPEAGDAHVQSSLMQREAFARPGVTLSLARTGAGRPFLFQHGLGGDALQTADVFPPDSGWSAVTLECRGHGQSEAGPAEAYSIATFADDVISVIEAKGWGPLPIGGISMGAAIALRIAALRRDLVSALVLARPAWRLASAPANMAPNRIVGELLRDHPADEARNLFERSALARDLEAEAPDNLVALRGFFDRRPTATTAELLIRISNDGPGLDLQTVAGLQIPTLVIGAARDAVHPLALAREWAGILPRARFVEVASKSDSRERYREDFRSAFAAFLATLKP